MPGMRLRGGAEKRFSRGRKSGMITSSTAEWAASFVVMQKVKRTAIIMNNQNPSVESPNSENINQLAEIASPPPLGPKEGRNQNEDSPKTKNSPTKKTYCRRMPILVAVAMSAVALLAIVSMLMLANRTHSHLRREVFVELDYAEIVYTSFHLPITIEMSGENNKLKLEFDTVERVFPYKKRIFAVLHGTAVLVDIATGTIREKPDVAMRFSVALSVEDGPSLALLDAELDSLSVYSDNPDVQAIVQRKTSECWQQFISVQTPRTIDIAHLSFKPERDVQIEENGVFVFGEETQQ